MFVCRDAFSSYIPFVILNEPFSLLVVFVPIFIFIAFCSCRVASILILFSPFPLLFLLSQIFCYVLFSHPKDLLSAGCRVPTLFLNSYEFHWEENLTRLHELIASTWKNCGCESDADEDVYCPSITIADSKHQNHADLPLIRSFILRLLKSKKCKDQQRKERNYSLTNKRELFESHVSAHCFVRGSPQFCSLSLTSYLVTFSHFKTMFAALSLL